MNQHTLFHFARRLHPLERRALYALCIVPILVALWCQVGCLAKVDRSCTKTADCQGFETPHICFQKKCTPGVCNPDPEAKNPEPCYCKPGESKCDQTPKGACQKGVRYCVDNGRAWSTCFGPVFPSPEICDGEDNDCDGEIDEGKNCDCPPHKLRTCLTGVTERNLKDSKACLAGIQRCTQKDSKWRWGACLHHHQPGRMFGALSSAITSCQLVDFTCDGKPTPPELASCSCTELNKTRPCYTGPQATLGMKDPTKKTYPCQGGTQTCIPVTKALGQWSVCQKQIVPLAEELDPCNGKDDDCDGKIDNTTGSTAPLWRRCGPDNDTKDCKIEVCLDGATWSQCKLQELCANDQDDNCDGKIDEASCIKR